MSFSSFVLRLILKNTSLLLSVTLRFRCSEPAGASFRSGDVWPSSLDMVPVFFVCGFFVWAAGACDADATIEMDDAKKGAGEVGKRQVVVALGERGKG